MLPRLITVPRFGDARGWFSESYSARRFADIGIHDTFVQDNQSFSAAAGTVRGLHFQAPPKAQAKLVRVAAGAIWDIAVDIRRGSPSYGGWVAATLTAEGGEQLYVPSGFAHGFATLRPDTMVLYKASDFYAPEGEGAVRWDDPDLAIEWPVERDAAQLSAKDAAAAAFAELESPFEFDDEPLGQLLEVKL